MRGKTPAGMLKKKQTLAELLGIMAQLRSPSGCPWDRSRPNRPQKIPDRGGLRGPRSHRRRTSRGFEEELGDLLLQIIFLSRIAEEKQEFDFSDVVHTLAEKLIRRHPHVFPPMEEDRVALRPRTAQDVVKVWG